MIWHYPKELYDVYESLSTGSGHMTTFALPQKWVKAIMFFIALIAIVIYMFVSSKSKLIKENTVEQNTVDEVVQAQTVIDDENKNPVTDTNQSQEEEIYTAPSLIKYFFVDGSWCKAIYKDGHIEQVDYSFCEEFANR